LGSQEPGASVAAIHCKKSGSSDIAKEKESVGEKNMKE
jgi:hypothetical protein